MRPALFVQDIQNEYLYCPDSNKGLRKSVEERLNVINDAISWFRKKGLPVIVGCTVDEEHGLVPGTKSFEVPPSVRVKKTDFMVTKLHASAFANPDLGAFLKKEGCDTIFIVGLSASGCVLATYFSAPDWHVRPYLIKGGVASHNKEHIKFAEDICDTMTMEELASSYK